MKRRNVDLENAILGKRNSKRERENEIEREKERESKVRHSRKKPAGSLLYWTHATQAKEGLKRKRKRVKGDKNRDQKKQCNTELEQSISCSSSFITPHPSQSTSGTSWFYSLTLFYLTSKEKS